MHSKIKKGLFFCIILLTLSSQSAFAAPINPDSSLPLGIDYAQNDINFYNPNAGAPSSCSASGSSAPIGNFSPDPAAVSIFSRDIKPKLPSLIPDYQKAAQAAGLNDWQLLAGLHYEETGMSMVNPTTNTGFRGVFQMSAQTLSGAGINVDAPPFIPGEKLTDADIVTQAQAAIKYFIAGKAKASTINVDISKPLTVLDAEKLIIGYKSGEGSTWLTGKSDPNLHAYAWAGYDTTPQHKLPMPWGPGSPYGDEVPGSLYTRPGALMIWAEVKGGNVGSTTSCTGNKGSFSPITGDRQTLVQRLLNNQNLKLGNFGSADLQKSDIQNVISLTLLKDMIAIVEQSGAASLPVNALKSDHSDDHDTHAAGRAVDIGYYANDPGCSQHAGSNSSYCNSADGNKIYWFVYNNYQAMNIIEIIWEDPPQGGQCIGSINGSPGPVDCHAFYKTSIDEHWNHLHVGVGS